jgi:hypothetical protein
MLLTVIFLNTIGFSVDPEATTHIFIQKAKSGTCIREENSLHRYKIVLNNASPRMLFFSNYNMNKAQMISTESFVKAWKRNKIIGYFDSNPATGLLSFSCDKFKDMFTFIIRDIKYDHKKKRIICKARLIPLDTKYLDEVAHTKLAKIPPMAFKDACLNISNPSEYDPNEGDSWGSLGG